MRRNNPDPRRVSVSFRKPNIRFFFLHLIISINSGTEIIHKFTLIGEVHKLLQN